MSEVRLGVRRLSMCGEGRSSVAGSYLTGGDYPNGLLVCLKRLLSRRQRIS